VTLIIYEGTPANHDVPQHLHTRILVLQNDTVSQHAHSEQIHDGQSYHIHTNYNQLYNETSRDEMYIVFECQLISTTACQNEDQKPWTLI